MSLRIYRERNPKLLIPNNTVGAISEYRVTIDLLSKGYEVFRAMSPACSCDLLVSKNHKTLRVEVTTAKYSSSGKVQYTPHDNENYDIIAAVLPEKIYYLPYEPL